MLDTVKLRSPHIDHLGAELIRRRLVTRQGIDNATGELLYELTAGELEGSYDHRIACRVHDHEWVSVSLPSGAVNTYQRRCAPFLEVEGSVHKAMLGHNVYGGPTEPLEACRWLVDDLGERLGVQLPQADDWEVRRVDWAEVYDLGEDVGLYLRGLNSAAYPRRRVDRYGDQGIQAAGSTTTTKLYHKGPELRKHDLPRLRRCLHPGAVLELDQRARTILRAEVSIKARKLDEDHGQAPQLVDLSSTYLASVYDQEVTRLLREGATDMPTVRTHEEVRTRLGEVYPDKPRTASALFSTWLQLSALGEDGTKRHMKRATFYLHRKQLQDAGVAWHGSDIGIVQACTSLGDFAPLRSDRRRIVGEDPRVSELLAPYRLRAA